MCLLLHLKNINGEWNPKTDVSANYYYCYQITERLYSHNIGLLYKYICIVSTSAEFSVVLSHPRLFVQTILNGIDNKRVLGSDWFWVGPRWHGVRMPLFPAGRTSAPFGFTNSSALFCTYMEQSSLSHHINSDGRPWKIKKPMISWHIRLIFFKIPILASESVFKL
jgi:hypothetical protein